jgi:glycerol-3-phosphate dehydrogenase (NAD(P)+)
MTATAETAVLGGGNWGTTLAIHLARSGRPCRLWFRDPSQAAAAQDSRRNVKYLPQWPFPQGITATSDVARALDGAGHVVFAVPSAALRSVAEEVKALGVLPPLRVCATKGLAEPRAQRPSEVLAEVFGSFGKGWAVLAGPSLAEEVLSGLPTAVVAASSDPATAARVQALFHGPTFRVYTSEDITGVELGVSIKNVLAIAAGLAQELGLGHNGYGALLTRGLAEIGRLGAAVGAKRETFLGLAGLGDLVTTCASPLSRNHQVGRRLARGLALPDVLAGLGSTAEGVSTTRSALMLAERAGVEMPITREVHAILFQGKDPRRALEDLMLRPPRTEGDGHSGEAGREP